VRAQRVRLLITNLYTYHVIRRTLCGDGACRRANVEGVKLVRVRLSKEEVANLIEPPEPEWDDEMTCTDGQVFRLSYERSSIDNVCIATLLQLEQAWVDLQALLGVKSRLASDPNWGTFPKATFVKQVN